ncbi:MAG: cytochrome-c peroxidase [Bdellovibrionales bacterium]
MVPKLLLSALLVVPAVFADIAVIHELPPGAPAIAPQFANQLTENKISLGKTLFFDTRLSASGTQSCATCHDPSKGFANGLTTGIGSNGFVGDRNVPVLFNKAWSSAQTWDGHVPSLEKQIFNPILNKNEMGHDLNAVLKMINQDERYRQDFKTLFSQPADRETVEQVIAAFLRSIVSGNSRYDLYEAGDTKSLSDLEKQGMKLFFVQFKCTACHSGYNFTAEEVRPMCSPSFNLDRKVDYVPKYKVPSLRNLAMSAPYFHSGELKTLGEVLDFYDESGPLPKANAEYVKFPRIKMTAQEKKALEAFLLSLNGEIYYYVPKR